MELTHQPKGSMCMACEHKHRNCSNLDFSKMRVMQQYQSVKIVICSDFRPAKIQTYTRGDALAAQRG